MYDELLYKVEIVVVLGVIALSAWVSRLAAARYGNAPHVVYVAWFVTMGLGVAIWTAVKYAIRYRKR